MKYNPFRPNNIVGPGMFVGRMEEIKTIERCLYQTINGNPQHFLIEGERGIGKSSLLYVTELISQGKLEISSDRKMNFLTVAVDVGGVSSQIDIIRSIAREFKSAIDARDQLKKAAKGVWDFLSKWEVAGVRYHKGETGNRPEDLRDELLNQFVKLISSAVGQIDGVFVVIDEADNPPEEAHLGEFLKSFTERLTRKGCNNVLFGLAGLPSTITKLRASHESSPRLLEILHLEPLTPDERKLVVIRGLDDGNKKNNIHTTITNEALEEISDLSEGYPHFIQQFSYFAFAEDIDNSIDQNDVRKGAYKENGALMQLGAKYFSEMYHARISSEDYRNVLGVMAEHGDKWISRGSIVTGAKKFKVSESNVNNALAALKNRDVIIQDESRKGFYKLPTKSFATWINAIRSAADHSSDLYNTSGLFD